MPPRLFRVPPLLSVLEAVLESLQQNFLGVCALSSLCAAGFFFFFLRAKKKGKKRERERLKKSRHGLSPFWTRTCTRVHVSVYTLRTVLLCACVHARGSQMQRWLHENTCFRTVRVSLRIHYHQHAGGHCKCPARPDGGTNTSTFFLLL